MSPTRKGRRWITALAILSIVTGTLVFSSSALGLTQSEFELDKNATNDLTTEHLATIKSTINSTATSLVACERQFDITDDDINNPVVVPIPAVPFTIQIDAEQLTVTALGAPSNKTGGCGFSDPADSTAQVRTWTITRGVNGTTAAAHSGGSDVTHMLTGAVAGDDWDQVHASVTTDANDVGDDDKCIALGAVECAWTHDGFDVTVFTTGGSKDDLNINPLAGEAGTGWKWTDSSVPPSDEILDAFAAKYIDGSDHQLLFFGADRWSTNGAKDFGFWFFHDEVGLNADGTFSGNHTAPTTTSRGDILLLGTFSQGGAVTTLRVFEWVGVGGNTNGTLQSLATFGDCAAGGGSPNGCNTVNNTTVPSPWDYQGAASGAAADTFYAGALMEGGIDLTELGLEGCFASFMAETRSSPEPGAQLKDFSLGEFEACETQVTTTPADGNGTNLTDTNSDSLSLPDIQIGTGSAGVNVTDNVSVAVTGISTWSGEVDFFVCGPIADPAVCDTAAGGVDAGAAQVVSDGDPTATSPIVNLTEVGRYCWRGEFTPSAASAAAGVEGGSDASLGECFEVLPVTPSLFTTARQGSIGLSPTIVDNLADLNGDGVVDGSDDSNAFYGDTSIINGALDCNAWGATENDGSAGDGTIDAADDCTLIGYDGTLDGVEIEVVDGEFQTADGPLPTVFNALDPDNADIGDSDFAWSTILGRVDSNGNEAISGTDCSFGIIGGADILGSDPGCGFAVTPNPLFNGLVDLNGDGTITTAGDTCTTGCFLGHDVLNGQVSTDPVDFGNPVFDEAILTGTAYQPGTDGGDTNYPSINATMDTPADGTITFTLVGPGDCTTQAAGSPSTSNPEDVAVTGDGSYITTGFTPDAPGDYHWKAVYDGSSPNTLGTSHNAACDEEGEDVTVQQIPTQIKTKQSWFPNDTATITSSVSGDNLEAGGTVDFSLFTSSDCSGTAVYTEQVVLVGGSNSEEVGTDNTSYEITTGYTDTADSSVGQHSWLVVYTPTSGDTAHTGIQSACDAEHFDITYTNDAGPGTDL